MNREIQAFFTAIMFYTRIPCPQWVDHSEEYLRISRKYFPLIGWIVGGLSVLVLLLFLQIFSVQIAVLLSMATGLLLTGAFHEDGFADTMDGFGGGWTKEKILSIMKDSRLGTYGAVSILLMLLLKFFALSELTEGAFASSLSWGSYQALIACFLSGHSVSRLMALTFFKSLPYARLNDEIGSKSKPVAKGEFPAGDLFLALVFGLLPLLLFQHYAVLLTLIPCALATWWMGRWFNKWIEGYTGDCLGAVQQVNEVVFYLSILALWKFI
ncbi:adenosylcobinamide-GDP ribazoletransferase [Echinicola sediminis]